MEFDLIDTINIRKKLVSTYVSINIRKFNDNLAKNKYVFPVWPLNHDWRRFTGLSILSMEKKN